MTVTTSSQAPATSSSHPFSEELDEHVSATPPTAQPHLHETVESAAPAPAEVPSPAPKRSNPNVLYRFLYWTGLKARPPEPQPNAQNIQLKTYSRQWLEAQTAELRTLIEASDVNMESFLDKLAALASFSFALTSQCETDIRDELYKQLNIALQEQQQHFHDKWVLGVEATIAAFSTVMGGAGAFGVFKETTMTGLNMISSGGQSVSKLVVNHVEAKKTAVQTFIAHVNQQLNTSRERSASYSRQSSEMESRLHQARQLLQNIVDKITG